MKLTYVIRVYVEEGEALLRRLALRAWVVAREAKGAILVNAFVILLAAA